MFQLGPQNTGIPVSIVLDIPIDRILILSISIFAALVFATAIGTKIGKG